MSRTKVEVAYSDTDQIINEISRIKAAYEAESSSWPLLTGKGQHVDSLREIQEQYDKIYAEVLGLYDSVLAFLKYANKSFEASDVI